LQLHTQENGSYYNYGVTEELFYRAGKKDFLSGKIWYTSSYRNLPPIVTNLESDNSESIKEATARALVEWTRFETKYSFTLRSAFIDQFMNYKNDSSGIDDDHKYSSLINRLRFTWSGLKKWTIKPGADLNYDWVSSEAYDGLKTRLTAAVFSEFNYELNKKVQSSLVVRQEFIDDKFMPFIITVGLNYKPFNKINLSFSTNLARNYRYPTLNELYWKNFGNPDLLPETDYSAELGVVYQFTNKNRNFFIETELTGYYSFIQQLTQWVIYGNTTKPENVGEVLARGMEAGLNLTWSFYGFTLTSDNNYHFCRSTYEKATSASDASVGKQLIYIPINTFNSTLNIKKYEFYLSYNFSFIGLRYTARVNLYYMDGYNLSNIIFGKNFLIKNNILSLQLQINNVFDLALRSIANVPMPGRNYAFTLRYNFRN
jgi:iron complex outermembrane receptor protein